MKLLKKAEMVVKSPEKFFNSVRNEKIKEPLLFDVAFTAAYLVGIIIIGQIFQSTSLAEGIAGAIVLLIINVVFTFIAAGLLQISVTVLGGKGGYVDTYKAAAYTSAISLGFILVEVLKHLNMSAISTVVVLLIALWGAYITIKGLSVLHKMSMWRALGVLVLTFVIVLVIVIILISIAAAALYGLLSAIASSPAVQTVQL